MGDDPQDSTLPAIMPWYKSDIIRQQVVLFLTGIGGLLKIAGVDWGALVTAIFAAIAVLVPVWTILTRLFKPTSPLTARAAAKMPVTPNPSPVAPPPPVQGGYGRVGFLVLLAVLSVGCAGLSFNPTGFNDKVATALTVDASIRDTALALGQTAVLTPLDVGNIEVQADNLRAAINIARTLHMTDASAGEDRLTAAISGLTALQTYLTNRKQVVTK